MLGIYRTLRVCMHDRVAAARISNRYFLFFVSVSTQHVVCFVFSIPPSFILEIQISAPNPGGGREGGELGVTYQVWRMLYTIDGHHVLSRAPYAMSSIPHETNVVLGDYNKTLCTQRTIPCPKSTKKEEKKIVTHYYNNYNNYSNESPTIWVRGARSFRNDFQQRVPYLDRVARVARRCTLR